MTPPLLIAIPAWGEYYVDIACRFTIPAVVASLKESRFADVTFLIHTDDEPAIRRALLGFDAEFVRVPHNASWHGFIQAHQQAINRTPSGGIVALLNADIVVSREAFDVAGGVLSSGRHKVIASTGIRTSICNGGGPPIGADAPALYRWCWDHRHPLTEQCVWGRGRVDGATVLFFEDGTDVSLHCFHLCPMFIRKDRDIVLTSTIDVGVLGFYQESEVFVVQHREIAFAEISPETKTHPCTQPLSISSVMDMGRRRFTRHSVRNFKHRVAVIGSPARNHPAADSIIKRLPRI